ncbi:MAG: ankyrin repeat domain-containing protein, partial [Sphingomonadaceae bacterium]|nr:ankyrin repeat domain-containing protein [Sphingomonadaceae bacterium]
MARALFRKTGWATMAVALLMAVPASAQFFSDGYTFLKAVKDRDGDKVTEALNEPGNTLINSRDLSSGETALHIVTQRRDTVWIKFLSQKGANPNVADKTGTTPLMLAVNLGFVEGAQALIDAGARVDVTNDAGETPLIASIHRRDIALLRLLLSKGANPDRTDNSGRSARDYAALMQGNSQIIAELERADEER